MIPVFIPSFYAHVLNAVFLLLAAVAIGMNFSKLRKLDAYGMVKLLLIASIAVGVHGLSHQGLERNYDYNPLVSPF
jgi:hypothetical protein